MASKNRIFTAQHSTAQHSTAQHSTGIIAPIFTLQFYINQAKRYI